MPEPEMDNRIKRIRLWVSYDGTNYHGWQIQNNGVTIESELNRALSDLYGQDIKVIGASRTDAGVHALGNVAVYDTESPIPAEKVCHALNARLPEDIRVTKSEEVPADWHPRKCASRKTYEYRIYLGEVLPPVKRLYSHHVYRPLDIEAMRKAAAYLVGEHDFKSFCQENTQALSTIRTVYSIDLILTPESAFPQNAAQTTNEQTSNAKAPAAQTTDAKAPDAQSRLPFSGDLILRITGNGFLYNMVRIIAGTLLEVGVGRYTPEEVARILEKKDRAAAGPTAPAKGLTLVRYEFPESEPTADEPAEE